MRHNALIMGVVGIVFVVGVPRAQVLVTSSDTPTNIQNKISGLRSGETLSFDQGTIVMSGPGNGQVYTFPAGLHDIRIEGDPGGTVLLWSGVDVNTHCSATPFGAGFRFDGCSRVSVSNLTFTVDVPLATEGVVGASDIQTFATGTPVVYSATIQVDFGSGPLAGPYPMTAVTDYQAYDRITFLHGAGSPRAGQVFAWGGLWEVNPSGYTQQVDIATTMSGVTATITLDNLAFYQKAQLDNMKARAAVDGDIVCALVHQFSVPNAYGLGFFGCNDVRVAGCSALSMQAALRLERTRDVRIEDVVVAPKDPGDYIGATRSVTLGVYGCGGNLTFSEVEVVGAMDDDLDVTGCVWLKATGSYGTPDPATNGLEVVSSKEADVGGGSLTYFESGLDQSRWAAGGLAIGDRFAVYTSSLEKKGVCEIVSVAPASGVGADLVRSTAATAVESWGIEYRVVRAEVAPFSISVGDAVALLGNVFDTLEIERCSFTGGRGTAVMVSGPNVRIEDCTFQSIQGPAIRAHAMFDTMNVLNSVGPPCENLVIRGNKISDVNEYRAEWWDKFLVTSHYAGWEADKNWATAKAAIDIGAHYRNGSGRIECASSQAVRNVVIEWNVIEDTDGAGVWVGSATNVLVANNEFGGGVGGAFRGSDGAYPNPTQETSWWPVVVPASPFKESRLVGFTNCSLVMLQGNFASVAGGYTDAWGHWGCSPSPVSSNNTWQ